eukprot:gene7802-9153_t
MARKSTTVSKTKTSPAPSESIQILVLAWQMDAQENGYFTSTEFVKGLEKLRCHDLVSLKRELENLTRAVKANSSQFSELYKFAFAFCPSECKKSVDLETASEMLQLILPDGCHTQYFTSFLKTTKSYKAINKDQWVCFLEFSKTVKKDLSNYDDREAYSKESGEVEKQQGTIIIDDE